MIDVKINGKEKSYPIFIESFEISKLKEKLFEIIDNKNFVIVISEKVQKIFGKTFDFNKENLFILKDGEKEKNFKNYQKILNFCLKKGLTREDYIIAIGGGVVGDITGFVASTFLRGINFIQVPTTLLACVDSSVGGKTAINTDFGKNLVGTFYQPKAVVINPKFLKTLDLKNLKCGLGEIVKYAFIEKSCQCYEEFNILNLLNENYKQILNYDLKILTRLIDNCIKLKVSVVEKDEKETNLRRILNFGHTYGHAIEKYFNYKYSHGECIVAGIIFAFDLALKNNLIEKNYEYIMQDLIKKFDFVNIPKVELKKIISIMKKDKKSSASLIKFILPVGYAQVKDFDFNEFLTIS